jgi:hypothetical protein
VKSLHRASVNSTHASYLYFVHLYEVRVATSPQSKSFVIGTKKVIVCQDTEENKIGLGRGISLEVPSAVPSTVENRSVSYV